jgi:AcrR family transcriptional regulator
MSLEAAEERRSQSRAETRRAILDATEALLIEGGDAGLSVRRLAARSGYSAPTIYHHFGDKHGVIDALLEERLTRLVDELERVPQTDDPVENLRALTHAFAMFGLRHPAHYQLLMQVREEEAEMIEAAERARLLMETPAEQIAARGWIELADLEALRQAIWTMVHGIVSLQALRPDVEWRSDLLDQSLEGVIRGWLKPRDARESKASRRPRPASDAEKQ